MIASCKLILPYEDILPTNLVHPIDLMENKKTTLSRDFVEKNLFRIVVVNNGCNFICVKRFLACIFSGVQQPAVYLPAPSISLRTVHQRGVYVHPTALGLRQGPGL